MVLTLDRHQRELGRVDVAALVAMSARAVHVAGDVDQDAAHPLADRSGQVMRHSGAGGALCAAGGGEPPGEVGDRVDRYVAARGEIGEVRLGHEGADARQVLELGAVRPVLQALVEDDFDETQQECPVLPGPDGDVLIRLVGGGRPDGIDHDQVRI